LLFSSVRIEVCIRFKPLIHYGCRAVLNDQAKEEDLSACILTARSLPWPAFLFRTPHATRLSLMKLVSLKNKKVCRRCLFVALFYWSKNRVHCIFFFSWCHSTLSCEA
jgi:hypothetical protein